MKHLLFSLLGLVFAVACASTATQSAPIQCALPAIETVVSQASQCVANGGDIQTCAESAGVSELVPYLTCALKLHKEGKCNPKTCPFEKKKASNDQRSKVRMDAFVYDGGTVPSCLRSRRYTYPDRGRFRLVRFSHGRQTARLGPRGFTIAV